MVSFAASGGWIEAACRAGAFKRDQPAGHHADDLIGQPRHLVGGVDGGDRDRQSPPTALSERSLRSSCRGPKLAMPRSTTLVATAWSRVQVEQRVGEERSPCRCRSPKYAVSLR